MGGRLLPFYPSLHGCCSFVLRGRGLTIVADTIAGCHCHHDGYCGLLCQSLVRSSTTRSQEPKVRIYPRRRISVKTQRWLSQSVDGWQRMRLGIGRHDLQFPLPRRPPHHRHPEIESAFAIQHSTLSSAFIPSDRIFWARTIMNMRR